MDAKSRLSPAKPLLSACLSSLEVMLAAGQQLWFTLSLLGWHHRRFSMEQCHFKLRLIRFCNCQQTSYEYEFIIVQLQVDWITFIGFFFLFPLPIARANYRIPILRQSSDEGEVFSVCCHYIILSNVKHASGRAVFVGRLCVEVHLPNWVVMSCHERGALRLAPGRASCASGDV